MKGQEINNIMTSANELYDLDLYREALTLYKKAIAFSKKNSDMKKIIILCQKRIQQCQLNLNKANHENEPKLGNKRKSNGRQASFYKEQEDEEEIQPSRHSFRKKQKKLNDIDAFEVDQIANISFYACTANLDQSNYRETVDVTDNDNDTPIIVNAPQNVMTTTFNVWNMAKLDDITLNEKDDSLPNPKIIPPSLFTPLPVHGPVPDMIPFSKTHATQNQKKVVDDQKIKARIKSLDLETPVILNETCIIQNEMPRLISPTPQTTTYSSSAEIMARLKNLNLVSSSMDAKISVTPIKIEKSTEAQSESMDQKPTSEIQLQSNSNFLRPCR